MSITALRALGGTIAAGSVGTVLWIEHQASTLPKDRQRPLADRLLEVGSSVVRSFRLNGKPPSIKHLKLVASLPSPDYAEKNTALSDQEKKIAKTACFAGYLAKVDTHYWNSDGTRGKTSGKNTDLPVFNYSSDLSIELLGRPFKNFIYAGETHRLSKNTREDLLANNYISCQSSRNNYFKPHEKPLLPSIATEEVLITGTTDRSKCLRFRKQFLKDIAYAAATKEGIDPLHPLSATVVRERTSVLSIESTGDLANLSPSAKQLIKLREFRVSPNITHEGDYKELGAITVTDPSYKEGDVYYAKLLTNALMAPSK
ncbi:MAG: hypothetical protein S4CHLAM7_02030 [Chlamydiae bacterium]|nr:hypothetical protein [Chlamydiota bacterium]